MIKFTDKTSLNIFALLSILFTAISAAEGSKHAEDSGLINVNLGESPVNDSPVQSVTLFGCNERIEADVFWDTDNQIVGNIPYRWRTSDSGKDYFASKYYVASPPVFRKGSPKHSPEQRPYIGLVTPDSFTFKGEKPSQIMYFDYRILQPTYLSFIAIDYDYENDNGKTCRDLGVDLVPVNTQCSDFPWRNGALGAAGIGYISKTNKKVFLPFKGQQKTPLNCTVSVLDDIMLDFDVQFSTQGARGTRTASLIEHYASKRPIEMICYKREKQDKPSGCRPPD